MVTELELRSSAQGGGAPSVRTLQQAIPVAVRQLTNMLCARGCMGMRTCISIPLAQCNKTDKSMCTCMCVREPIHVDVHDRGKQMQS